MIECESPWIHTSHRSIHRCHDISRFHLDSKWKTNRKHIEVFKWLRPRRREYRSTHSVCISVLQASNDMSSILGRRTWRTSTSSEFVSESSSTHLEAKTKWLTDVPTACFVMLSLDMSRPLAKIIKHVPCTDCQTVYINMDAMQHYNVASWLENEPEPRSLRHDFCGWKGPTAQWHNREGKSLEWSKEIASYETKTCNSSHFCLLFSSFSPLFSSSFSDEKCCEETWRIVDPDGTSGWNTDVWWFFMIFCLFSHDFINFNLILSDAWTFNEFWWVPNLWTWSLR